MQLPVRSTSVAAFLGVISCFDLTHRVPSAEIVDVWHQGAMVTGAEVAVQSEAADSVRVLYASTSDPTDTGRTPWFPAALNRVAVLGLRPRSTYTFTPRAMRADVRMSGPSVGFATLPLPEGLRGVSFQFTTGHSFSRGFDLLPIKRKGFDSYLVAFDSTGVIRWYRDMGPSRSVEAKQQENGDFTVFVAGDASDSGAYVELGRDGDSVRSVVAPGSRHTDVHELITTYDQTGKRVADYLTAFDSRPDTGDDVPGDSIQAHEVLRIDADGKVDTLIKGWRQWSPEDQIEPGSQDDIDHPNAITFDRDSGLIVSYRSLSAVVKLRPESGKIQWILGGAHNQFTFVDDPYDGFDGQHYTRVLPNGHLLMFDNGWHHAEVGSRAVEYELDEQRHVARMVWQYVPTPAMFVNYTGSAERLANGNTLVTFTSFNTVDEVDCDGKLLARAQLVGGAKIPYRVVRVASLYSYRDP